VLDLPSESREKSSQKRKKLAMQLGRPTYVQSPKPTTETSRFHALATRPELVAFRATKVDTLPRPRLTNSQPAPIGIRIIALRTRKPCMRANGRPIAKLERKLFDTPPSHFRTVTRPACAVARLAREINYCFLPLFWLRRAGMSHSLGSLRRTVTLSSCLVYDSALAIGKTGVMQGLRW
jgi:hypothetical protein